MNMTAATVETNGARQARKGMAGDSGGASSDPGMRRCIVTRSKKPREELLRFVVDPEGRVTPDVAMRLPGRGVWVLPKRDALAKAVKTGRFKSAFKADVSTPDDLVEMTTRLLDRRIGELLGLARAAGQLAVGWEQSREFSRKRPVGLVVVASDAAEASRRRLERMGDGAPVFARMDAEALGAAMGRERVVNALVSKGKFADMLAREAARRDGLDEPMGPNGQRKRNAAFDASKREG
jgi:predicted RNA-binding protein YlxR (DUF448 family)